MIRKFTFLFLLLFILSSCSAHDSLNKSLSGRNAPSIKYKDEIPADFFPREYNIVAIGDSLTQGVGDSTKRGGYIPYLQAHLETEKGIKEANFTNLGIRGTRTDQLVNHLKKSDIRDHLSDADMVIITTGGNDLMKVVRENFSGLLLDHFVPEKENYQKNFNEVIRTIRELNENVVICAIGLYNPYYEYFSHIEEIDLIIEEWNSISRQILDRYPYTYFVDISHVFQENGEELLYTKDYFHPNDKGYEVIADEVYTVLNEQALEVLAQLDFATEHEE